MSHDFSYTELIAPHATEWSREATAAYGRSLIAHGAVDTRKSSRKPRGYDVRNMHGKVWKRARSRKGPI